MERHAWDVSTAEARNIQERLRERVILQDRFDAVSRVGGIDVGFEDEGKITRAAAVVLSFPELRLIDRAVARLETRFPYVPGLLSFREIPAVMQALEQLSQAPDIVLCDGQGYAHPRRFGLACHLGVLTGIPTIGAAKTRLIGRYDLPGPRKGSYSPLVDKEEQIGVALRTRSGVSPMFVSCGHGVSLASAVHYVLSCCTRYRLPETTRWAHRLASGDEE